MALADLLTAALDPADEDLLDEGPEDERPGMQFNRHLELEF